MSIIALWSHRSRACPVVTLMLLLLLTLAREGIGAGATGPPPPAAAAAGRADDEILKPVVEEARLNFLAGRASDLKIPLPPGQAFGFANSNRVDEAAGRVARGMETRDKFLGEAPKLLDKRRKEVEQVLSDKLPEARELVAKPHNQAEVFVLMLTHGIRQMHLPPADEAKPRAVLGKRLQRLYDEDAKRRGGKAGPEPDDAWLRQYHADVQKELFDALGPDHQQELTRV